MIEALISAIKQVVRDIIEKAWVNSTASGQFSLQYAVSQVDSTIYLFGGRVGVSTTGRSTCYKYSNNAFTAIASLPTTLVAACSAVVGRKIYIFGGAGAITAGTESKKVYIYDIDANSFTTGTDMPVNCVVGSCAAVGTDIYVYGGMNSMTETGFPKLFYKYDTVAKTWTSLPYHDGQAMLSTNILNMGGLLYAFGGEYANAGSNENDVRVFDPVAVSWSKPTVSGTKPQVRGACAMIKYDETRFIIQGGRSGSGTNVLADAWVFDIVSRVWTALPSLTKLAFHRGGLVANNDVIVFDGYNGTNTTTLAYRLQ
mgnify:CR=1 FL=1